MDVTDQASIDAAVAQTIATFGQIDILINNAAAFTAAPITEIERADYARTFDINVAGVLFTMQAVARHMIDAGVRGRIINMASQAGRRGEPLGNRVDEKAEPLDLGLVDEIVLVLVEPIEPTGIPGLVAGELAILVRVGLGDEGLQPIHLVSRPVALGLRLGLRAGPELRQGHVAVSILVIPIPDHLARQFLGGDHPVSVLVRALEIGLGGLGPLGECRRVAPLQHRRQ